jgi:hypothetical protein
MSLMNELKKIKDKLISTTSKMKKKYQEQHLPCTQDQEGRVRVEDESDEEQDEAQDLCWPSMVFQIRAKLDGKRKQWMHFSRGGSVPVVNKSVKCCVVPISWL